MTTTAPPLIALNLLPSVACAASYQWKDADGNTMYPQFPPPEGREAARIVAPPPPPAEPEAAKNQLHDIRQRLANSREDRGLENEKQLKASADAERRAENCRKAKGNLQILQQRTRQLIKQPDGSFKRYTTEEKARKIAEYSEIIARDCH